MTIVCVFTGSIGVTVLKTFFYLHSRIIFCVSRSVYFKISLRMEDLEFEYTPSLFSKRFKTSEEIVANFTSFAKTGKTAIK